MAKHARRIPNHGGGWQAITYVFKTARATGGLRRMWRALRSRNACKTCALGMGGQRGGMVNEQGHFPEVCKKSVQAMGADLQEAIDDKTIADLNFERMARLSPRELERLGRLCVPLIAGPMDLAYRPITWKEALDRVVGAMRKVQPDESFFYLSGRSSNEAAFLSQVLARLWGTNNVNNCSFYCHQASGVGLTSVTGSGTATVTIDDLDQCDLVVLIGANPASNHPRLMRSLMQVKRRGGRVIVINPIREVGLERFKVPSDIRSMLRATRIADLYVQPNIGGDAILLTGITRAIIERGDVDEHFTTHHTLDWEETQRTILATPWSDIVEGSGVDQATIERAASMLADSTATIFCWAMGITHHRNGVKNVQHIANLAISRGMIGSPGRGLLPLRGHSNVQGIGSMGVAPQLKQAFFDALQSRLGVRLPTSKGLDTLGCLEAAHRGEIKLAWCLGGNLWGSNPDQTFAAEALSRIDTVVSFNTTLNQGHVHGRGRETIILPVLARDEEPQATTQESMFNLVRLSDGGRARHEQPRAESAIIAAIGEDLLGANSPLDFARMRDHDEIRRMIAEVVPGYAPIGEMTSRDTADREFHVEGRTCHSPNFATESGRVVAHPITPDQPMPISQNQVRIMTIRSEGQFNTVVYEEHDLYRGQERRDVILMNAKDITRLGLTEDERIELSTSAGSMTALVRRHDIAPGNAAMYFPEANCIVPRDVDPQSRTPAFKSVVATITRCEVSRSPSSG